LREGEEERRGNMGGQEGERESRRLERKGRGSEIREEGRSRN